MSRLACMLIGASLVLLVAVPAFAVARIVTPPINSNTALTCRVVNASDTKPLEITITIYNFDGTISVGPDPRTVPPNGSEGLFVVSSIARHCVVEVIKGGKKNARVSLYGIDAAGVPSGAVTGE